MVETPIVEKIRKLLKLAADPSNSHEAALAAERAQELLFRHHLDMADVADDTSGVVEADRPLITDPWRKALAALIARFNFCRLLEWTGGMKFIGAPADVETVLYLYTYLSRTIYRLARESWEKRVEEFTDPVLGRHPALDEPDAERDWKDSFRIGAVEIIGVRLEKQRRAQEAMARYEARKTNEPGLVRATSALQAWDGTLARYIHDKYGPVTQAPEPEVGINLDAFSKGVRTGKSLPISRGIGAGTDRRRIDG
jgi:hypothetical protein